MTTAANYAIGHIDAIPPIPCPCGTTQRAFTEDPDQVASLHVVTTEGEARAHYHRTLTEIYYFLEGEGQLELDGKQFDVRPGSIVLIKPGCRHRAIGKLKFINVPIPAFDAADEWFD